MNLFKNEYFTKIHVYSIVFATVTLLLAYIIPLAKIITNQTKLFKEYYYDNFNENLIFDYFLIGFYFIVFHYLKSITNLNDHLLMTLICCSIATIAFVLIVYVFKNKKSFFYRWFTQAGLLRASTYDIILVNSMLFLYNHILNKL